MHSGIKQHKQIVLMTQYSDGYDSVGDLEMSINQEQRQKNDRVEQVCWILKGSRKYMYIRVHWRRLREGLWDGPHKLEVGDSPCIRPPNISRSSVVRCVRKYELSKKRCHQEFFQK